MISIKRIKCGNGNCFLVHEDGIGILVDTAKPKYKDFILKECSGIKIKLIVLTHGHMDHALNAAELSKALNAPIAIHSDDIELIEDNLKQPLKANTVLGKILLKLSIKTFEVNKISNFNPKVLLKEGMSLKEFGINATIVELSGHTNGSIGVIVGQKDIIVGDALMNMVYPTKSMIYTDRERMEKSVKRIELFQDYTVHFGHGQSVVNKKW